MKKTIYAGTYTGKESHGIYQFFMEDGKLSDCSLLASLKNPKYIAVQNGKIASISENAEGGCAALLNTKGEILDQIRFEADTSCYIAFGPDGCLYTANYHAGTVSKLAVEDDHLRFVNTAIIREGAGCHQVLFYDDLILVPCLLMDMIVVFDQDLNRKDIIRFNAGTGPRHGVFSKDNTKLYLVSELSNELFVLKAGTWEVLHQIPVLENNEKQVRGTAAIRMNEQETRVYVSTRGKDVLSVINIEGEEPVLMQNTYCGGRHPRDFILCDGYLISANRFSNNAASFELNEDGTIGKEVSGIEVPEAVSLAFES